MLYFAKQWKSSRVLLQPLENSVLEYSTLLHVSPVLCHHQEWLAQITICSASVFKLLYGLGFLNGINLPKHAVESSEYADWRNKHHYSYVVRLILCTHSQNGMRNET
jgi:hypothetical protein